MLWAPQPCIFQSLLAAIYMTNASAVTRGPGARLHQLHPGSANFFLFMELWDSLFLSVPQCCHLYSGIIVAVRLVELVPVTWLKHLHPGSEPSMSLGHCVLTFSVQDRSQAGSEGK